MQSRGYKRCAGKKLQREAVMIWIQRTQYSTQSGEYMVSKQIVSGQPIYSAWHKDTLISTGHKTAEEAKKACVGYKK